MLNDNELRVRRLAFELWERSGQRGVFAEYMEYVEAEMLAEAEREQSQSQSAPHH